MTDKRLIDYDGTTRTEEFRACFAKHDAEISPAEHFLVMLRRRINVPTQRVLKFLRRFLTS